MRIFYFTLMSVIKFSRNRAMVKSCRNHLSRAGSCSILQPPERKWLETGKTKTSVDSSTEVYLLFVIKADRQSGVPANATSICGVRFEDAGPYIREIALHKLYILFPFRSTVLIGVPANAPSICGVIFLPSEITRFRRGRRYIHYFPEKTR